MRQVVSFSTKVVLIIVTILLINVNDIKQSKVENNNVNKTINFSRMALKAVEEEEIEKFSAKDTYTGDMTGYAYNCPLCNGTLSCLSDYNIKNGTTTFYDNEYGNVFIVAASKNLPCGSIVRFKNSKVSDNTLLAIVLDRGVLGNSLDLLVESEAYAYEYIGRSTITYDVLRSGW